MSARSIASRGLAGRKVPQGTLDSMRAVLFANGEQGVWYDPSDMATLFQDAAGTLPVTAVEQPVGRILDKSGRGNHATQATAAKRPVLSARVNQALSSEKLSLTPWTYLSGTTVAENATPGPSGTLAGKVIAGTSAGNQGARQAFPTVAGQTYIVKFKVKSAEYTKICISDAAFSRFSLVYDLTAKALTYTNGLGYISSSFVSLNDGWALGTVVFSVASTVVFIQLSGTPNPTANPAGAPFIGDGVSGIYITEIGFTSPDQANLPYQRVNTATDYDSDIAKFPWYLRFDGVDDALVTGNIDFTGTDKMSLWAGVRKLSDASAGVVCELSRTITDDGTFGIYAPASASAASAQLAVRGTLGSSVTQSGVASPVSLVLAGQAAMPNLIRLRTNGAPASSSNNIGPGPYGNYPLNIGARNQTGVYFNGHLYGLIIRGAASTPVEIAAAEYFLSQKTGVRLP